MLNKTRKKKLVTKKVKAKRAPKPKYSMLPLKSSFFHPTERKSLLT